MIYAALCNVLFKMYIYTANNIYVYRACIQFRSAGLLWRFRWQRGKRKSSENRRIESSEKEVTTPGWGDASDGPPRWVPPLEQRPERRGVNRFLSPPTTLRYRLSLSLLPPSVPSFIPLFDSFHPPTFSLTSSFFLSLFHLCLHLLFIPPSV